MKKRNFIIITCLISLFLLTGCFTKKEITTDQFTEKAGDQNFQVVDVIEQYENVKSIKEATVAREKEKDFQIEFYVLDSKESASKMFEENKKIFQEEEKIKIAKSEISATMPNYDTYKLITNGKYKYLCRVEKTLIYINTEEKYKKEIESFLKEIGY